jgi:hypothetical protein
MAIITNEPIVEVRASASFRRHNSGKAHKDILVKTGLKLASKLLSQQHMNRLLKFKLVPVSIWKAHKDILMKTGLKLSS